MAMYLSYLAEIRSKPVYFHYIFMTATPGQETELPNAIVSYLIWVHECSLARIRLNEWQQLIGWLKRGQLTKAQHIHA